MDEAILARPAPNAALVIMLPGKNVSHDMITLSFLIRHRSRNNLGLVLDLGAQLDELDQTGMFRHTPPSHVMLAFKEALLEYSDEGGLKGRVAR